MPESRDPLGDALCGGPLRIRGALPGERNHQGLDNAPHGSLPTVPCADGSASVVFSVTTTVPLHSQTWD